METLKNLKKYILSHPIMTIVPVIFLIFGTSFVQILDRTKIHRSRPIEYIIVHYTANQSPKADATMNALYLQKARRAGTHYCIDDEDDGSGIIQCTEEFNVAWAIGDRTWPGFRPKPWLLNQDGSRKVLNNNSISYEMCLGGNRNDSIIIDRTAQQIGWQLVNKGLDISRVLRHHDVTGKYCPRFFYSDPQWNEVKEDSMFAVFRDKVAYYQNYHLMRKNALKLR